VRELSRDTRRRLALYGGATLVAILVLAVPPLVKSGAPRVEVAEVDIQDLRLREATRLLREYVRIDSSNPPGRTVETARFWAEKLGCEGIPFEIVGSDPERPIVVARLAGRRRGEALLLLHHMDVVPAGDLSKWEHPPFGAVDGTGAFKNYVCGRGTIDMKGQGIANFLAIASLRRDGLVPERDLVFVAEPGEETYTPQVGIGWLWEHRPDLLAGVTDVFNEGGVNEVSGDRIARFGIEVLQKAAIIGTAEAARKEDLKAFAAYLENEMTKEPYHVLDEVQDFLAFIAPARSDLWGHPMNDTRSAVRSGRLSEEIPEPYRALLRDMYYVGRPLPAPGGTGYTESVLVTLLPGRSARERWEQMQSWAGRYRVRLHLLSMTSDSVPVARKGRAWETLQTVLALDPVEHADVGPYVLTGSYTNSSYIRLRGDVRAFGLSPFALNILDAVTVHSHNERIFLPAYIEGVERTARIVREYALAP
jgi:acetylornithine deacetylase/succinyl-diaminopimelate desuccinylase-like protein